ncbi:hypothetical protein PoB_006545900 [Plakobranchus ocellatus]|uniref:Uncharacterized protein n=1 Tax=Plakobranchus ocellatus TaxID=259542 RepID=A0AAV4D479_9GAST|nr:hypothetical protein PoB_006545900 [Plakobranchus ocellatus]
MVLYGPSWFLCMYIQSKKAIFQARAPGSDSQQKGLVKSQGMLAIYCATKITIGTNTRRCQMRRAVFSLIIWWFESRLTRSIVRSLRFHEPCQQNTRLGASCQGITD